MRNSLFGVAVVATGAVSSGAAFSQPVEIPKANEAERQLFAFETLPPAAPSEGARPNIFGSFVEGTADVSGAAAEDGKPVPGMAWLPLSKLWEPGAVLRVCFISPNGQANSIVAQAADRWNQVSANVRLDFGSLAAPRLCGPGANAHIRVGYNDRNEFWSAIGRDALVNVRGWNDPSVSLDINAVVSGQAYGTILHEFGHALGLNHEHQRPSPYGCESEIVWDRAIQYYQVNFGWAPNLTYSQLGPRDPGPAVMTEYFDPTSIMMYPFPAFILAGGSNSRCFVADAAEELSEGDRNALVFSYDTSTWAARGMTLRNEAETAAAAGNIARARGIAAYALPMARLNEVAEAYEREGALGFTPAPGESAAQLLDSAIVEVLGV
jgi:hypothetical protein